MTRSVPMETFVVRVWVAAEPEPAGALRGFVDHSRTGGSASFAGGAGLVEAVEAFLEPRAAEQLGPSAAAPGPE